MPNHPPAKPLPRATSDVVQTADGKSHVVISRGDKSYDGTRKCKSIEVRGVSTNEKLKNLADDMLGDHSVGEWLP